MFEYRFESISLTLFSGIFGYQELIDTIIKFDHLAETHMIKNMKLFIVNFLQEIKPVVTMKYEFEARVKSLLIFFLVFQAFGILIHR